MDPREGFIRGKPGEMFGLPVKIDLKIGQPFDISCQEASPVSQSTYIPCGEIAKKLVLSERGTRLYFMCDACASHNIRNRGAILIASHEKMNV